MTDYTSKTEIPYGYCHCGCGQKTKLAYKNDARWGHIKGQPRKFCLGHGVRRFPIGIRFWLNVNKNGTIPAHCPELGNCWEWIGSFGGNGYGKLGRGKNNLAHRISYELATGINPNELFVLHKCDNPKCVRPDHLFLGTQKDNMQDKVKKKRDVDRSGEGSFNRKLDWNQVREIRQRYAQGNISMALLGIEYNISQGQIGRIIRNERWIE